MDICRICLAGESPKDILELQSAGNIDGKSFVDIITFCLDIQVEQDSKISTKLCTKCFKKILSFHEFKCLALKNDAYLKTVHEEIDIKNEILVIVLNDDDVKNEQIKDERLLSDDFLVAQDVTVEEQPKDELYLKSDEDSTHGYDTDDEFLNVIKNTKYEGAIVKESCTATETKSYKKQVRPMCEECGKSVNNLKIHALLHLPVASRKNIKCSECDKMFTSHSGLKKHIKLKHTQGSKQKCLVCNKMVTYLTTHHNLMHNRASLPYGCMLCGHRFISNSRLGLHMKMRHTKERPHPCTECDKKFYTKHSLRAHKREVHDNERKHLCQLCPKSFFKKNNLQIHLRSHSKEKPCECPKCGKCFSTPWALKTHLQVHEKSISRTFDCSLCDMTFKKQNSLKAHLKSHIKKEKR